MDSIRDLLDLMEDLESQPENGDILDFEFGDETMVETTVIENLNGDLLIEMKLEALEYLGRHFTFEDAEWQGVAKELSEAEYQGRKVSLGKPFLTPDGPKKRSVYVRNPKGNVVKVNFGQKGVKIKKNNPARRKSFRARHGCDNPGPRHRAKFWSCKFW